MNFGFGKNDAEKKQDGSLTGAKAASVENKEKAEVYLGAGSSFEGEFKFAGPTYVNCRLKGNVIANSEFTLGPAGEVTGNISGFALRIAGKVTGDLKATKAINLSQPAEVYGDISAPKISIADGVIFNGSCAMKAPAEVVDLKRPASNRA